VDCDEDFGRADRLSRDAERQDVEVDSTASTSSCSRAAPRWAAPVV